MDTIKAGGIVTGLAALLLVAGQPVAIADEDDKIANSEAKAEAEAGTRWARVTGSRIYREVPERPRNSHHVISHMPMYVLTREELDVTAASDVGRAVRESDPSSTR